MVDVLLTHSYHLLYDPKQVRKMQPYPPLGTLYAAALLRQHGASVALFDAMLEEPEGGLSAALARHKPRVVAIYEDNFNFLSKMCLTRMRDVAFGMVEAARSAGAIVAVNGSDASDHAEEYLRRGADYILLGEAEWTLLELVEALSASAHDVEDISGLAFMRPGTAAPFRTAPRSALRNLDELPFPARDLIDIERYRNVWKSVHGIFSLNAVASRGCPFRCNWCAKPIYGNSFHARPAESVAAEMQELKESFGAEHLWFADDIFALKPRWALELAESVSQRGAALPFKIQSRVDLMGPETAGALRRAGCTEVWLGVESGSQAILDAMDKGTCVKDVVAATANLRRAGIRVCFFLQFGYPGERWADIQETVRLVRVTQPDDIGVSVAYPLPGTKFYERVHDELGTKKNWVDSDDLAVMFHGTYTREFYRALRDALHAEVETWSPAAVCGDAGPQSSGHLRQSDPERVHWLWSRVEGLERICRNPAPSLSAALA